MGFKKAERRRVKLRLALCGPSGSGKTYSALKIAKGIGDKIALIDTENGSGSLYSDICDYDVEEIKPPFTVDKYITAIKEAELAGYEVLIIDSLTHAWAGQGGLLEEVDKRSARSTSHNSYAAWRDVTPMHNKLVDTILQSDLHIITTMRSKTAYELEKGANGKVAPVKKGMAPIQRDGLEYEFTVVLDLDNQKHVAEAGKDRTGLFDGKIDVPSEETGKMLKEWLESGINVIHKNTVNELVIEAKQRGISGAEMTGMIKEKFQKNNSGELTEEEGQNLLTFVKEFVKENEPEVKA
jgi:hypothetical protein